MQIIGSLVGSCVGSACLSSLKMCGGGIVKTSARAGYVAYFIIAVIVAEIMRDYSEPLLKKIPWIVRSMGANPSHALYGNQAVYRICCGAFAFFGIMSLCLIGVKSRSDRRDKKLHHGSWVVKTLLFIVFLALPFFLPDGGIEGFVWLARFGSGLFLVIQFAIYLDFAFVWNESWVAKDSNVYYGALLAITLLCHACSIVLVVFMFRWFKPDGDECSRNTFIIVMTIILSFGLSALSLHPNVRPGCVFPSALIGVYCTYLGFSALTSLPKSDTCNGYPTSPNQAYTVVGLVLTAISVVYSALRAGSSKSIIELEESSETTPLISDKTEEEKTDAAEDVEAKGDEAEKEKEKEEKDEEDEQETPENKAPSYNYAFFHLTFALAAMYVAMLMTGWGEMNGSGDSGSAPAPSEYDSQYEIDVGYTSMWIKVGSQWLVALLYIWSLIAPLVFPDREFS